MQYQYQMKPNLYTLNTFNSSNSLNQIGSGKYSKINVYVIILNIALVYGIASLYYILMTAFTDTHNTAEKKRKHFYLGIIIAIIIVGYFKPFKCIY